LKKIVVVLSVSIIGFIIFSNLFIIYKSKSLITDNLNELPDVETALLLGTSRYNVEGGVNLFFKYRMEAAYKLYKAKKIKHFLVSGDNSEFSYNEPREMRRYLIQMGIPDSIITLDYAGFRTLDSVVRAKKIFGLKNTIIISQKFHLQRAIFISKIFGLNSYGFMAQDVPSQYSVKTYIREIFAKTKAILDIYVLRQEPKYLGEKEIIEVE
jgi:SanA protein